MVGTVFIYKLIRGEIDNPDPCRLTRNYVPLILEYYVLITIDSILLSQYYFIAQN